jgi:YbbR domain-containing protein
MKNLFTHNLHIKLIALMAATIFWFFILSSENTFYAVPDTLTIEPFNLPEGLAVVNDLGTAKVTIRADQETYKNLTAENFTVYVDLKGLASGTKAVDLSVNSKKADISVIDINPQSVTVVLEEVSTRDVSVVYELIGDPEENYSAFLSEQGSSTVTVSGAESVLETIEEATAYITLNGDEIDSVTKAVEVIVVDSNGMEMTQVSVEPKLVEVTAIVELEQAQKTVGIKVNVDEVEEGWVSSMSTIPQVIHLIGDADVLDQIEFVETSLIEIPEGELFHQETITLTLPPGTTLATGESETIEIIISIDES